MHSNMCPVLRLIPQGPDGETPLIMATSNGHYEIVRLLVNAGADVNHADEVRTAP